jgi:hypothetical protein
MRRPAVYILWYLLSDCNHLLQLKQLSAVGFKHNKRYLSKGNTAQQRKLKACGVAPGKNKRFI